MGSFGLGSDPKKYIPATQQESVIKERLQRSGQIWNDLFDISGGSLALHKINWRMIAWEAINGELKIVRATEEVLILEDGRMAKAQSQSSISNPQIKRMLD